MSKKQILIAWLPALIIWPIAVVAEIYRAHAGLAVGLLVIPAMYLWIKFGPKL